jgi:uncharacterized protein (DUF1684 family)
LPGQELFVLLKRSRKCSKLLLERLVLMSQKGRLTEMNNDDATEWIRRVQDFRKGKDEFFSTSHESPLAHSGTHSIKMLRYFPPDLKYKIHTVLHKYDKPEKVLMTTSKRGRGSSFIGLDTLSSRSREGG